MPLMISSATSASRPRPRMQAQIERGKTVDRPPIRWTVEPGPVALDLLGPGVHARDHRHLVAPGHPAAHVSVDVGAVSAGLRVGPVAVGQDQDVQRLSPFGGGIGRAKVAVIWRLRAGPGRAYGSGWRLPACALSSLGMAAARLGNAAHLQRGGEPRAAGAGHRRPSSTAGRARQRRTLVVVDDCLPRRHRRDRRPARRRAAPGRGAPPARARRASAPPTSPASATRTPRGADLVIVMDADFSHDPAHLPALIAAAEDAATSCSARAT